MPPGPHGRPRPENRARKRFGQHFLEPAWVAKVVRAIAPAPEAICAGLPGLLAARVGTDPASLLDRQFAGLDRATLLALVGISALLLAVVMPLLTVLSRLLGFSREDEIAIVFCGSKKTLASGVPMAQILFAGQAVGLLVLPLMVFHQLQLMVCAPLARRYAERPEKAAPAP